MSDNIKVIWMPKAKSLAFIFQPQVRELAKQQ